VGTKAGKLLLFGLDGDSPILRWSIQAHTKAILSLCFSPDSARIATRTKDILRIRDARAGDLVRAMALSSDGSAGIVWSQEGLLLCQAPGTRTHVINTSTWAASVDAPLASILPMAGPTVTPDGRTLAVGSAATATLLRRTKGAVRIYDEIDKTPVITLEAHTRVVTSAAFSSDGRLLATQSFDNTIALFRTDTWAELARVRNPLFKPFTAGLAFSPTHPLLALPGPYGQNVLLWSYDIDTLLAAAPTTTTLQSVSAKVVLLGEGRAGKTCLALRLAEDRYEEQDSTHGMRLWSLPAERIDPALKTPNERREIILWDMGGQPEYRLVHQLFLREATAALLVMEPGRGQPALDEIEGWNERLSAHPHASALRRILVGTKLDDDNAPQDLASIERTRERCNAAAYVPTSARRDRGLDALKRALAGAIDWSSLVKVSRPELFERIRTDIHALRKNQRAVLTFRELESALRDREGKALDPEAIATVVSELARQGLVAEAHLSNGDRALVLDVEQIERYASSLIVAARESPSGVPALDMALVLSPSMRFPRLRAEDRLPRDQELAVLDCVVELLLEHGVCFRHEGLLVFPSLFPPSSASDAPSEHAVSLYYELSGEVDGIYASVVASIATGRVFGPARLSGDHAEFGRASEHACGLRKVERPGQRGRGIAQLEIHFDPDTPEPKRVLFVGFVEDLLRQRGVRFLEKLAVSCACGFSFPETSVRKRLFDGRADIVCPECEERTPLTAGAEEARGKDPTITPRLFALRNEVREMRAQSVVATKESMSEAKRMSHRDDPIRILHLSDLHVGKGEDPLHLFQPLAADLRDPLEGLGLDRLDYLVVSGDLTNRAAPVEFEGAHALISRIIKEFGLTAERCIVVPGNHDLDWEVEAYAYRAKRKVDPRSLAPGTYCERDGGYLLRLDEAYPQRFKPFSDHLYHPLFQQAYPLAPEQQAAPILFPNTGLVFLPLNSAWEIDEYFQDRSSIHGGALSRAPHRRQEGRRGA
jgi:small GTP-binding protein